MNNVAIYPGTFDPMTYGHVDILQRALGIFAKVMIAVSENPQKNPLFSLAERIFLVKATCSHHQLSAEVHGFNGLLLNFAKRHGASILIRGLRGVMDFEYESQLAYANRALLPTLETVFILPAPEFRHLSSRLIQEIAALGGDVSHFLPLPVQHALDAKLKN